MKSMIEWARINIQIIVLVPALLGGLWQLFELSNISVSYIRFFSVTQLIADGLLVLFLFGVIALAFFIEGGLIGGSKNEDDEVKSPIKRIKRALFLTALAIVIFFTAALPALEAFFSNERQELAPFWIALFLVVLCTSLLTQGVREVVNGSIDKWKPREKLKRVLLGLSFIMSVVLLFALFIGILIGLYNLRESYLIPETLMNFDQVGCFVQEEFNLSKDNWDIVYFNDQYIFIEIAEAEKPKHLVVSFNQLLDFQNCTKVEH